MISKGEYNYLHCIISHHDFQTDGSQNLGGGGTDLESGYGDMWP